ncbi:hypothetical protein FSP39_017650 [Pinctada imbricata]|uniref:PHD-type domain-containing protein n=1 Tax=Pinctada imbricata TaxID=66713 RepID=A0AA89BRA9_PINIB|nr:hypothetical protein FSP39_017650 [Pinctada imbricata]
MADDTSTSSWDNLIPKVKAVGLFSKHCVNHEKTREELNSFVSEMKISDHEVLSELARNTQATKFRIRRESTAPEIRITRDTDKILKPPFNQDQDLVCSGCDKAMDPFKDTWYPCRACSRVFHKECVKKLKSVHKSVFETLERANTNTGWSCHICDDLSLLLNEEELNSILEKFERIAQNRDSRISLDDYIAYNTKISEEPLTQDDVKRLSLQFKLMDLDKNNYIEWWEFLNHEAKIKLGCRSEGELVSMLSEKEVIMAKSVFRTLDENHDGSVTEWEARRIYKSWYRRFDDKKDK